jgi:DNA-binding winged helix-turn-helix (wHTH) protein/pimeloyl-ACP methyl ester carboxylesterase
MLGQISWKFCDRSVITRGTSLGIGCVSFGDCDVDLEAFEVRRGGETCPVEPQVFDLLAFLVNNPDRLVTKDELIDKVWHGRIVSDATLASRLRAARRAIGDDGEQQKLIRTVHRRGIRFLGKPCAKAANDERHNEKPPALKQEIRFCRAGDGVRLAYATTGSGQPLVKPANWLSHLEFDLISPVWRHWIAGLSRDHMLLRYDKRANGLSDWNVENLTFDALVSDLEAVVEAAGLDRFPMFCLSQGCAIAIAYALRNPGRVTRMVLYGGYARGYARRGNQTMEAQRTALGTLMQHGWGQDNPVFRQIFTSMFIPDGTAEHQRWFNDIQQKAASPANAYRIHKLVGEIDIRHLLPQLDVPTLVLHSRDDQVVPFEEGRILACEIPGARFVPLESKNHVLMESEPAWERLLAETRAFLSEKA